MQSVWGICMNACFSYTANNMHDWYCYLICGTIPYCIYYSVILRKNEMFPQNKITKSITHIIRQPAIPSALFTTINPQFHWIDPLIFPCWHIMHSRVFLNGGLKNLSNPAKMPYIHIRLQKYSFKHIKSQVKVYQNEMKNKIEINKNCDTLKFERIRQISLI